jgi:hypothetical protein
MISLLLALVSLTPGAVAVSVTQCGADPTGKTDSSAAFAACLKTVPAGDVVVPAGKYLLKESVAKNRNQNLIGAGTAATTLMCEMTNAPCVVVADTTGGVNNYNASKIQDLTLQGPGLNNASVGIYLGGDPNGQFSASDSYADGASLVDVRVLGFDRGVEWGNNAWGNKLVRTLVFANATGLYAAQGLSNAGENLGLTDSSIFNNRDYGIDDHANFEWMISGTAFDYNGTAIEFFGSTIHAVNCHFEQSGAQVMIQPYGSGSLSIKDSEILVQSTSGSDPYILSTWPQYLNVAIDNVSIWSNHPVQYFMRVQGTVRGSVNNLNGNGNKMIGAISNVPSKAVVTATGAF